MYAPAYVLLWTACVCLVIYFIKDSASSAKHCESSRLRKYQRYAQEEVQDYPHVDTAELLTHVLFVHGFACDYDYDSRVSCIIIIKEYEYQTSSYLP